MKRGPLAPFRRVLSTITLAPIILVILFASLVVHLWEWLWYAEGEIAYDFSLPCAIQQWTPRCPFCSRPGNRARPAGETTDTGRRSA